MIKQWILIKSTTVFTNGEVTEKIQCHRCSLLDDHPRDEYFIIEIELKDSTCTGHPAESTGLSDL
jgi:hypothetical protein